METIGPDHSVPGLKSAFSWHSHWLRYDADRIVNPTQGDLRDLTLLHTPSVQQTASGSLNKVSRNKARQAKHTFVITDEASSGYSHKTIARSDAQRLIALQADYIQSKGQLIEIQGWVGVGPRAVPVQWLYTIEGANIAAMQQILAFPRSAVEVDPSRAFNPRFRVVYTPDFRPPVPGGQRILVDLDNHITYVMGPDYFGESKKGALRMLCDDSWQQGGLTLHAGAKEVTINGERLTVAILGLSGTGKTTTTFSKQGDGVKPVQDDMVTLWPGGELSITENGCFAKTIGLTEQAEPVIYRGTMSRDAWLENAYLDADGTPDFFKSVLTSAEVARLRDVLVDTGADPDNVDAYIQGRVHCVDVIDSSGTPRDGWDFTVWTANGRSIIPMSVIEDAANPQDLPPVRSMGVLNRDEGSGAITPGLVRFTSPEQVAGYFMLGETTKTSAAGKDRGRVRSPFTQPFFPRAHENQAVRFTELLETAPWIRCWMMNTGYVGGDANDVKQGKAHKVKIRHSSAMLEALFGGNIVWTADTDFGYEVVDVDHPDNAALVQLVGADILCPQRMYARDGRTDVYRAEVAERHSERERFLRNLGVDERIVAAVVPSESDA